MKVYYLASPYTDKEKALDDTSVSELEQYRYEEATRIAAKLTKEFGFAIIAPITTSHNLKRHEPGLGTRFDYWKDIDLAMIGRTDGIIVALMQGAFASVGVQAEMKFAVENDLEILYYDPRRDILLDNNHRTIAPINKEYPQGIF